MESCSLVTYRNNPGTVRKVLPGTELILLPRRGEKHMFLEALSSDSISPFSDPGLQRVKTCLGKGGMSVVAVLVPGY
ncbi:guanine nucleotide-binding protein G(I)/G(S)/G(O) subunit gamma-7 isoform X1 [Caretta caretta]|uniref:guanine nucleotide-binding protein G(I)/G(S)/G(O) subunit gamma-7 isoform X1 n=1 Tax=Caretta caretta TaxID=8467 RepID=UPI003F4C1CCE